MNYKMDDLAYIYIATNGGEIGRSNVLILYITTILDAQKICQSEQTKGKNYGSEWALFWTDKRKYDLAFDKTKLKWRKDDGRFNKLFGDLGVKNLTKSEK